MQPTAFKKKTFDQRGKTADFSIKSDYQKLGYEIDHLRSSAELPGTGQLLSSGWAQCDYCLSRQNILNNASKKIWLIFHL